MIENKKLRWIWLVILPIVALACSFSLPLDQPLTPVDSGDNIPLQPTTTPFLLPEAVEDEQGLLIALYSRVNPAVVNITEYEVQGSQAVPIAQGSGFVIDETGHIVTNAHVVHGSDQLEVTFSDGSIYLAKLVGEDLNSDLAVIKAEKMPVGLTPLPLGEMESLAVGQTVVAIGNPFGLEGTLTRGIISALGRSIPALTPFTIPQAIQTDAAINPGNSGGPLLNLQGEVVGVNAQIETGGDSRSNSGVGFAIPVSIIRLVVPDLIAKGVHDWAWLGVQGGSLSPFVRDAMDLPVEKGAYISNIVEGGPAEQSGLQGSTGNEVIQGRPVETGGDVIIAINGQSVTSFDDLLIYISLYGKPGDEVTLTVIRDGKEKALTVVLEKRPENFAQ